MSEPAKTQPSRMNGDGASSKPSAGRTAEDQAFQDRATEVVRHQVEATNKLYRDSPDYEVPY